MWLIVFCRHSILQYRENLVAHGFPVSSMESSTELIAGSQSLSLSTLNTRVQAVEQTVHKLTRTIQDLSEGVEHLREHNKIKRKIFDTLRREVDAQKEIIFGIESRLAALVGMAVETSWDKLCGLQKDADTRQCEWHTQVRQDFQDAHRRIEEQVKTLREGAQAATDNTRAMIGKEVIKMEMLSENMLHRLDTLTQEHEAVQTALQDVTARQKDVKRVTQKMSGRVSDVSVGVGSTTVDENARSSTETLRGSGSSRRSRSCKQSSSDEEIGLEDHIRRLSTQLRILTAKFYKGKQQGEELDRQRAHSWSRESSQVRRSLRSLRSSAHRAEAEASTARHLVGEVESKVQDVRERSTNQEKFNQHLANQITHLVLRNLKLECGTASQSAITSHSVWKHLSENAKNFVWDM